MSNHIHSHGLNIGLKKIIGTNHFHLNAFKKNTTRSPFLVDLVAENERIDEENKVRLYDQARRQKQLERKKEEAKNAIILSALQEGNELESLRREKKKILEEERRLKALIDLEKTNATRKQDRIVAERAERKRRNTKIACRRESNKKLLDMKFQRRQEMLIRKHEIE